MSEYTFYKFFLLPSIFSFAQNVFFPMKDEFNLLINKNLSIENTLIWLRLKFSCLVKG